MFPVDNKRRLQPKTYVEVNKTGIAKDLVIAVNMQNGIVRNAVNGEVAALVGAAATQSSSCGLAGKLFATASYNFTKADAPASTDNFTILVIQNYKSDAALYHSPISFNATFCLYAPLNNAGRIGFYNGSADVVVSDYSAIAAGKSQTLVIKRSSTTVTSYINGVAQAPTGTFGGTWSAPITTRIGRGFDTAEYCKNELDLVLVWKRALTDLEIKEISANPWQVFRPYHTFIPSLPSSTTDITLALSGQSITSARGTLVPNNSKAITGTAATFSAGTLVPSLSKAITGSASTSATGTITPNSSKALSGTSSTVGQGSIAYYVKAKPLHNRKSKTVDFFGGNGWFDSDTVSTNAVFDKDLINFNLFIALGGQAITSARGTLTPNGSKAITGSSSTSSQGTLVPNASKAIAGELITSATGIISVSSVDVTLAIGGSSISVLAGNLSVYVDKAATGQAVTLSIGTIEPSIDKTLSGTQLSATAGFVTSGNDVNVALSGSQFSALSGTLSVSVAKEATGTASTLSVGQVVANTSKALSGSVSTTGQGSMTKTVSIGMVGGAVTPSAGSLVPNTSKAITGSASTLGQGAVVATFGLVVQLSGVEITTTAGNLSVTSAAGLSGSSADAQAGLVKAAMERALTGVVGTFSAGDLTAVISAGTAPSTIYVVYTRSTQNNVYIKNDDYNVYIKTNGYNTFYDNNSNYVVDNQ